ncbi:MAG: glycyl-radical enzyme activating protein [Planctomycetota bacterium]
MTRSVTGNIFDIQRFSIHDGPGIRTTVFMKGCPLRCIWCHNPESISSEPVLSFLPAKCIGCGYCFRVCPQKAHKMAGDVHVLDREACENCGLCTKECYAGALELVGREVTAGEALDEVLRDRPFYETSGGGMTLSGGEPTMQIEFAEAILKAAKDEGLHCCVETCGLCPYDSLERIRPAVDLFLYDYKETNDELHREFTGVSNKLIIENLRRLHDSGAVIVLRCPIISGTNDRDEHFEGIAALARELPNLDGIELMPYNPLGESKVERMGFDAARRARSTTPDGAAVAGWVARLKELGVTVVNQVNGTT